MTTNPEAGMRLVLTFLAERMDELHRNPDSASPFALSSAAQSWRDMCLDALAAAPVAPAGTEGENQWSDLKAWAESLAPEYEIGKRKVLAAIAARAQPPVGEVVAYQYRPPGGEWGDKGSARISIGPAVNVPAGWECRALGVIAHPAEPAARCLGERVTELLAANNRYQQEGRDARAEVKRVEAERDSVVDAGKAVCLSAWTDRHSRLHGHASVVALDAAIAALARGADAILNEKDRS